MSIIINLDFCGVAGQDSFWNQGCSAQVKDTCNSYVSGNPGDFADVFFDVAYIKIYELKDQAVSTTTSTTTTSTTSAIATTSATTTASAQSSAAAVTSSVGTGSGNNTISAPGSGSGSGGLVTSTVSETRVYTVTSCAPEITDCPARIGRVTTEVTVYTTVCPVTATETGTKPTTTPPVIVQPTASSTVVVTMQTTVKQTTTAIVVIPSSSAPAQLPPTAPAAPPAPPAPVVSSSSVVHVTPSTTPSKGNVTVAQPTAGVVTVNGGFKAGASFVLMAAGAALAFAL